MTDENETTRRASDKRQDEIDKLISEENDPKQRTLMIVLQSINRSLIANTISTQATQRQVELHRQDFVVHLRKFDMHAINEEALINKGKGAWWVMAFVLSLAQGIAIYGWKSSRDEIDAMQASVHNAELTNQKLNSRIEQLEKSK